MADRPLSASAQKVEDALAALGLGRRVVESERATRTSAEAAATVGCSVAQIAKSILFRAATTDRPVMVIASGVNRIDEKKVAALLGEGLKKADAEFVRARTGFVIGGVPPLAHAEKLIIFLDRDLLALPRIWAAAGTPNAVFPLTPDELLRVTGGQPADIKA
ncbi:MAG: YbaK/EbsC family protein [Rhodospirillales bacterium]|nr:YbaK/EbsC family protein [Rhodospirillales bacterium]